MKRRGIALPLALLAMTLGALAAASLAWRARADAGASRGLQDAADAFRAAEGGVAWALAREDSLWASDVGTSHTDTLGLVEGPVVVTRRRLSNVWWVTSRATRKASVSAVGVLAVILPVTPAANLTPDGLTPDGGSANVGSRRIHVVRVPGPAWSDLP